VGAATLVDPRWYRQTRVSSVVISISAEIAESLIDEGSGPQALMLFCGMFCRMSMCIEECAYCGSQQEGEKADHRWPVDVSTKLKFGDC
jgi:hypothetical protein